MSPIAASLSAAVFAALYFLIALTSPIKITGNIANDILLYINALDGKTVAEIQLSTNNTDGTEIVIEPTTKKITVTDADGTRNGYALTDKTKQSFLYLPQGEYVIGSNIDDNDTGKIEFLVKRYLYD